ncbi:MAG: TonB-dependent receptor [Bryobacteraceae bacterium]
MTSGAHSWKFGGRLRVASLSDQSPQNFGGTFTFSGALAPQLDANNLVLSGAPIRISSIEQYRRTLLLQAQGLPVSQIRSLGGGASQFSLAGGNPLASVRQTDVGVFLLDDWRVKPNLTLSYGVRYERQNNIDDASNISPRLSFAWGVGGGAGRTAKTVARGGFGVFYDRVGENLTLQALRFNGSTQQQFIVRDPDFYPNAPSAASLTADRAAQTIRQLEGQMRAPYIAQTAIGVDRQLPRNTAMSMTYTFSRGVHMLRTRNVNAPLPDGSFPYGNVGNIYQFESSGSMRQNQLITNINTRFNPKFSLFGFYMLNFAKGDTDGIGTFPANNYDLSTEWGSTMFDVRHRLFLGGSVTAPSKVMLSPFITASSGSPFNITSGFDSNSDTQFNDRPAFGDGVSTPWGSFRAQSNAGDTIIPRNFGRGPAQFAVNMRLSRTWGFGTKGESGMGPGESQGGGCGVVVDVAGRTWRWWGCGPGGPGGMFGDVSTGKRFNVTLSVSARNLQYRESFRARRKPDVASFGQSLSLAGGFGPMGSSASSNRRLDFQLRFSF